MSRGWTFLIWSTIWLPGFPDGSHGKEPACQCRRKRGVVQSLGREDPLEKEMAAHSNILAWRMPWTEEPGGLQSMGLPRVGHNWRDLARVHTHTQTHTRDLVCVHTHTHTHTRFPSSVGGKLSSQGTERRAHALPGLCCLAGAFRDPNMLPPHTALNSGNLSTGQGIQTLVLKKFGPQQHQYHLATR